MGLYTAYPVVVEMMGNMESMFAAKVECFDEVCSTVTVTENPHTVESWRELSQKIEQALESIHPQGK